MQSILMDRVVYAHQRAALQLRHHGADQVAYLEVDAFEGEQEKAIQAVDENGFSFVSVY